jgi:hypothetical protein
MAHSAFRIRKKVNVLNIEKRPSIPGFG